MQSATNDLFALGDRDALSASAGDFGYAQSAAADGASETTQHTQDMASFAFPACYAPWKVTGQASTAAYTAQYCFYRTKHAADAGVSPGDLSAVEAASLMATCGARASGDRSGRTRPIDFGDSPAHASLPARVSRLCPCARRGVALNATGTIDTQRCQPCAAGVNNDLHMPHCRHLTESGACAAQGCTWLGWRAGRHCESCEPCVGGAHCANKFTEGVCAVAADCVWRGQEGRNCAACVPDVHGRCATSSSSASAGASGNVTQARATQPPKFPGWRSSTYSYYALERATEDHAAAASGVSR